MVSKAYRMHDCVIVILCRRRDAIVLGGASLSSSLNLSIFNVDDMAAAEYPKVQGGGSLILAWQIRNKRVLVVGGGEVWFDSHILTSPHKPQIALLTVG